MSNRSPANREGEAPANREGEAPAEPKPFHPRHHPIHGVRADLHTPILVFVTVCTKNRQRWLADPVVHNLLRQVWNAADAWLIGRYVILTDHVHLFAAPNAVWECGPRLGGSLALPTADHREGEAPAEPPVLDNWIRYWKSQFTKQHSNPSHRWQSDHWDRRLRTDESSADKWEYVRNNPVRHGLVAGADAWPYQGELNEFVW